MGCLRRKYYYWEDGIHIAIGSMLKLTSIRYITHSADINSLEKHDFPSPSPTVSPPSLPASTKHSPATLRQSYPQLHCRTNQPVTRCNLATFNRITLRRGVSMARVNHNRCARKPLEEKQESNIYLNFKSTAEQYICYSFH